ncbi:MAG: hypothetical protein LBC09_03110 [Helicobacteraceae bacterium]|jgi:hypothetical protein|nr:hypothetical protein [Helicobacteraceae bacterium]
MRTAFLIVALAVCAFAHRLNLFVTDENGTIYIHSYFTKSAPCKGCAVTIFDPSGAKIARAQTDDEGKAAIALKTNAVTLRADGGMGHQAEIDYELTGEFAQEVETPLWLSLAKGALGLAIIALFFGALWFIKRKKPPPNA